MVGAFGDPITKRGYRPFKRSSKIHGDWVEKRVFEALLSVGWPKAGCAIRADGVLHRQGMRLRSGSAQEDLSKALGRMACAL